MRTPRGLLLLVVAALTACHGQHPVSVLAGVHLTPEAVDFGEVWVGHPSFKLLEIRSTSRAAASIRLSVEPPFRVAPDDSEFVLEAAQTRHVRLQLIAEAAGPLSGELIVSTGEGEVPVPLRAVALAPLQCAAATDCGSERFDPEAGRCVLTPGPDGMPCANACIIGGTCRSGACVGQARSCDDGLQCTVDACSPSEGCVHTPVVCGEPSSPCRAAFCDEDGGCREMDVADGTICGRAGCAVADVCLAGQCVEGPVPDGAACGAPSPCQASGICVEQQCVRPPPVTLEPEWTYARPPGIEHFSWGGVADDAGNVYFTEHERLTERSFLTSLTPSGRVRFRVEHSRAPTTYASDVLTIRMAAKDALVATQVPHQLIGFSSTDGRRLWMVDLEAEVATALQSEGHVLSHVAVSPMAETSGGEIVAVVESYRRTGTAVGVERDGAWLVRIRGIDGAVLAVSRAAGGDLMTFGGAAVDGLDRLHVQVGFPGGLASAAVRLDGTVAWSRRSQVARPLSSHGTRTAWGTPDQFCRQAYTYVTDLDGEPLYELEMPGVPLFVGTRGFIVGKRRPTYAECALDTTWPFTPTQLDAFDLATGATIWSRSFEGRRQSDVLAPTFTAQQSILFAHTSPLALVDVSAVDGTTQFECALTPDLRSVSPVLAGGRWIVLQLDPWDPSSIQIAGYATGGRTPSTHGYMTPGGSHRRTGRGR